MKILRQNKADFNDFLKMLRREPTDNPVLFEIFMDGEYYEYFSGKSLKGTDELERLKIEVEGFYNAGFTYATTHASKFGFPIKEHGHAKSISLNEGNVISDWDSFKNYNWQNPEDFDCSKLEKIKDFLPDDMKLVVLGPGGVLENTTSLIGYDNMCYMLFEDPDLLKEVFDAVGSRLLKYYEIALEYDCVGAIISNDDWGFNSQTFLSVPDMRKYVFPWHKKIAAAAHAKGKPAILHSCGYMMDVMEDIIEDMKFDAKHSFEDKIFSVEKSYDKWGNRIAILGGLDLDFLITSSAQTIQERAAKLLDKTMAKGGYALGSGNSWAHYIPDDKICAMVNAGIEYKK